MPAAPALDEVVLLLKEHLGEIFSKSSPCDFKNGQVLFYEGHRPHGLHISEIGKVRLLPEEPGAGRLDLLDVADRTLLGLGSLLTGRPYPSRAVASADTKIYFLSRTGFFSWIEKTLYA